MHRPPHDHTIQNSTLRRSGCMAEIHIPDRGDPQGYQAGRVRKGLGAQKTDPTCRGFHPVQYSGGIRKVQCAGIKALPKYRKGLSRRVENSDNPGAESQVLRALGSRRSDEKVYGDKPHVGSLQKEGGKEAIRNSGRWQVESDRLPLSIFHYLSLHAPYINRLTISAIKSFTFSRLTLYSILIFSTCLSSSGSSRSSSREKTPLRLPTI